MRKLLGGCVLIAGIVGLGYWGMVDHAARIEADLATRAAAAITPVHDVQTSVSGRDITVRGLADNAAERDAILDALDAIDGRRVVRDELDILAAATPYMLTVSTTDAGFDASGNVPSETIRAELAARIADPAQGLDLASGAPAAWMAAVNTGLDALYVLNSGTLDIHDTNVTLTGEVANPDAAGQVDSVLTQLPDGFTGFTDLILLDDGKPFSLYVQDTGTGVADVSGKLPADMDAEAIMAPLDLAEMTGMVDVSGLTSDGGIWNAFATQGLSALARLETGTLTIEDTALTLTGLAREPATVTEIEADFASLAEDYTVVTDFDLLDDGSAAAFSLSYDANDGASVTGKLPNGLTQDDITATLGVPVTGDPTQGLIGDAAIGDALRNELAVFAGWLTEFERARFSSDGADTVIEAETLPGVDTELVAAELAGATEANVNVAPTDRLADDGAIRTNLASGEVEQFNAGFWLPVIEFEATDANCALRADDLLAKRPITFLTGSARLDATATRTLNALGSVVRACLARPDMALTVGGHTDSQGDDALNLALSLDRASAVSNALRLRGVDPDLINAMGFGETMPIADNETIEGRALNRRTTIEFYNAADAAAAQAAADATAREGQENAPTADAEPTALTPELDAPAADTTGNEGE